MIRKTSLLVVLSTIAMALAASPATAQAPAKPDLAKAKEIAQNVCAACHGADGNSPTPNFPKLAGQHADYLAKALNDYKSGARKDPIMGGMSAALSKQDVENLAAYYATQPGLKTK